MLGKEPPFQDIVHSMFYTEGQPSDLRRQRDLLVAAAATRSAQDRSVETANLAVNALALGYLSTLIFWGVLQKVDKKKRPSRPCPSRPLRPSRPQIRDGVIFLSGKDAYQALPWSEDLLSNLQRVVTAGRALNEKCVEAPSTLEEYSRLVQELEADGKLKFPGAATSKYVRPWVIRMRLVTEMRAQGIRRLKYSSMAPLSMLGVGFPDQKAPGGANG